MRSGISETPKRFVALHEMPRRLWRDRSPQRNFFCPQAIHPVQLSARVLQPGHRVMVEFLTFPARSVVAEGPDILTARA